MTFVFEGQQIATYLFETLPSLLIICFYGRLFLIAALDGVLLADFGLDFGSEATIFLAD